MRRRADPRKTTPLREPGGHDGHGADDHVKPIKRRPSFESRPRPIGDVLAAFREWLHLPDPAVVEVACGAVVANRVETFDPTWLLLIGAAGSGKTEALNATRGGSRGRVDHRGEPAQRVAAKGRREGRERRAAARDRRLGPYRDQGFRLDPLAASRGPRGRPRCAA